MNLILFPSSALLCHENGEQRVIIQDQRRITHLREVHRAHVGGRYRLGQIDGPMGEGELLRLDQEQAEFSFDATDVPPPALNLHLVLALPRPRMLARSLQNIATLGVKQLTLINTARVEKSFWKSPELNTEKIQHHFELGLEQARDTIMPRISMVERFKPFAEDELPTLLQRRQGMVADPRATMACPRGLPLETPLLLAIGPEGGFVDYEVEQLYAAGCRGIHLGSRILRVETAVVALLSRLY